MEVSIDKEIIISAIAANYNISKIAVDLSKYSNRQILESLEYYLRYRNGRLLWNRDFKEEWMVYTVQMDLYIDDDEIYSDEDISNIIEESMSVASVSVDHIKVIAVND